MAAITPIRPTARRVFLPPKAEASVASRAPSHKNRDSIDKHEAIYEVVSWTLIANLAGNHRAQSDRTPALVSHL
jgi:hypothetical protein